MRVLMAIKKAFFFVWGLPQNLIGLTLFLLMKKFSRRVDYIGDSVVLFFNRNWGAVSLGMFIFVFSDYGNIEPLVVRHEYGHSIQSKILGPLYLLIIGIPSIIWAGAFENHRREKNISYYDFYTERWANHLVKVKKEELE